MSDCSRTLLNGTRGEEGEQVTFIALTSFLMSRCEPLKLSIWRGIPVLSVRRQSGDLMHLLNMLDGPQWFSVLKHQLSHKVSLSHFSPPLFPVFNWLI